MDLLIIILPDERLIDLKLNEARNAAGRSHVFTCSGFFAHFSSEKNYLLCN